MQRVPEPELMDSPDQAQAYAGADFSEPNALFVEHALSHLNPDSGGRLVDLGCGPGDICLRLARALPGWRVTGVDAGPNMLALANRALADTGLENRVRFELAHLPDHRLSRRFDAVVSNSLLHHLPDPMTLWQAISEVAAPGAYIQVMDLHRPDSQAEAASLVQTHAGEEPEVLRQDFYNSLLAAWTADEVKRQLARSGLDSLRIERPTARHWMVCGVFSA